MAASPVLVYGLMAEFDDPNMLVAAARSAHDAGYRRMTASALSATRGTL